MPADQPDDLDETFARIVADYDALPDQGSRASWPASEDVHETSAPLAASPPPVPPAGQSSTDPLNTTATWEDEGHFVPPPAPPLPRLAPLTLAAWCGVLGAPAAFLLTAVVGWVPPRLVTAALVLGFVAGIVLLIATTTRDGNRHDPDDGAVV